MDRTTATPQQLNAANRATRNKKTYDKDATEQVLDWQSTAATVGIAPCQRVSQQSIESFFQAADAPVSPQQIVLAAAERLSEKRSSFSYMELVKEGCRLSAGRYHSSEVIKAIEQSRELIPVAETTSYPSYTTRSILQRESQILKWAVQNKSFYATISDDKEATVAANKFTLNSEQAKALQHIARSRDLITLIQGSAGVGKTRSLAALKDLMVNRTLIGCAVGGLQAEALEAESGIQSQTLSSLIRTSKADFPQNALIVVDEAGVVSNRQMYQLIERAMSSNSRILLVGDTKQLSAVEQGNPFRLLQTRAGLETAFISQNMRQKDEQLKAVVDLCEDLRPDKAFDLLDSQGKISEIPNVDQRTDAIVADFLTRPSEQRRNTLVMATTHKERAILTGAIRNKLIDLGELSEPAIEIEVLQKKDLDKHHLLLADNYQQGDRVRFWRQSASFTKGELYLVTATNPEGHSIELLDTLGQTKTLHLSQYREREIFSPQRIKIAAGEEMRFTAGIKDKNGKQLQVNGQRFRIEAIDLLSQTVEISTKGKQFTVTPEDLLHSDYRWISTVHSIQGATAQYAIFAAGQGNGALLSKESWYVAASRAKLEFTVYCGDKARLRESIQDSKAQIPAIELIQSKPSDPIAKPVSSPRLELLPAQFQILTDQLLAHEAVYQEQGLRIERSGGQLTVLSEGNSIDLQKPENLASIVNHLQALLQQDLPLSLYEEFIEAARLEKSIQHQATLIVGLNQGNYHEPGLSVEITDSEIVIQLDPNLVFKSNQGLVSRPDDLLQLSNLKLQLQSSYVGLQQSIEAKLQQEKARLLASRLKAPRETTNTSTIEKQKGRGHGFTL